ncbi:MAG: DNA-3-methyladenine glycosylase [Verrucomicrobiales bacterium]|nr:DNA-3-methyladenine glycosylase [Verrucomicrobiales bacterium]
MDILKATRHLKTVDKDFAKFIRIIGPCTLKADKSRTIYASLIRSVVYQQLTGKVAGIIFRRLLGLFPTKGFPAPERILSIDFTTLRSVGLSKQKTHYIRNIAQAKIDGIVPDSRKANRMTDQQLVEQLTSIKGVGRWTVEMLLIFRLGRPDVLPATDFGVQKGFAVIKCLDEHPKPNQLIAASKCWSPYRTVAAWYLWRTADAF